jgi:tricarballylate dehydrogenase
MAREAGASVMLLEAAARMARRQLIAHTQLRCMHDAPQDVLVDAYPEEEYWQDLLKVTGGLTDEKLARLAIRASSSCRDWMRSHGVHFQPPLSGALHVARTNAFFMGGGKALVNAYYRSAEALGVQIRYAPVDAIELDGSRFVAARIGAERIEARACVLAAGGFESNREWLREAWGQNERGEWPADNFLIRGTRFNMGVLLKHMIAAGADAIGDPSQSHCVAIDARAALRRRHLHAHRLRLAGVVVNRQRRALLRRRGLLAQALCDLGPSGRAAAAADRLLDHRRKGRRPLHAAGVPGRRPIRCRNWRASWAGRSHVHAHDQRLQRRVPGRQFDHTLDDCHTEGVTPAKTHWARPIDTAPFFGYALRPGITFTYLGLKVNESRPCIWRQAQRQPVRGRRDDGRQRAGQGLHGRRRHGDRHRVRPHCRHAGRQGGKGTASVPHRHHGKGICNILKR